MLLLTEPLQELCGTRAHKTPLRQPGRKTAPLPFEAHFPSRVRDEPRWVSQWAGMKKKMSHDACLPKRK